MNIVECKLGWINFFLFIVVCRFIWPVAGLFAYFEEFQIYSIFKIVVDREYSNFVARWQHPFQDYRPSIVAVGACHHQIVIVGTATIVAISPSWIATVTVAIAEVQHQSSHLKPCCYHSYSGNSAHLHLGSCHLQLWLQFNLCLQKPGHNYSIVELGVVGWAPRSDSRAGAGLLSRNWRSASAGSRSELAAGRLCTSPQAACCASFFLVVFLWLPKVAIQTHSVCRCAHPRLWSTYLINGWKCYQMVFQ